MISATLLTLLSVATLATATINYNSSLTFPGSDSSFDGTIPAISLSESCGRAYAQDIPCDKWLLTGLDENASKAEVFSDDTLKAVCIDTCLRGLQKWRDDVRKSCTDKDVGSEDTFGLVTLSLLLNPQEYFIETLYWTYCIKDLNTGTFCQTESPDLLGSLPLTNVSEGTPEIVAFCKDNCKTQLSLVLWVLSAVIVDNSPDAVNVSDARKVCKGLDTSKYPFLKDVKSTAKNDGGRVGGGVGLLLTSVVLATVVVVGLGSF